MADEKVNRVGLGPAIPAPQPKKLVKTTRTVSGEEAKELIAKAKAENKQVIEKDGKILIQQGPIVPRGPQAAKPAAPAPAPKETAAAAQTRELKGANTVEGAAAAKARETVANVTSGRVGEKPTLPKAEIVKAQPAVVKSLLSKMGGMTELSGAAGAQEIAARVQAAVTNQPGTFFSMSTAGNDNNMMLLTLLLELGYQNRDMNKEITKAGIFLQALATNNKDVADKVKDLSSRATGAMQYLNKMGTAKLEQDANLMKAGKEVYRAGNTIAQLDALMTIRAARSEVSTAQQNYTQALGPDPAASPTDVEAASTAYQQALTAQTPVDSNITSTRNALLRVAGEAGVARANTALLTSGPNGGLAPGLDAGRAARLRVDNTAINSRVLSARAGMAQAREKLGQAERNYRDTLYRVTLNLDSLDHSEWTGGEAMAHADAVADRELEQSRVGPGLIEERESLRNTSPRSPEQETRLTALNTQLEAYDHASTAVTNLVSMFGQLDGLMRTGALPYATVQTLTQDIATARQTLSAERMRTPPNRDAIANASQTYHRALAAAHAAIDNAAPLPPGVSSTAASAAMTNLRVANADVAAGEDALHAAEDDARRLTIEIRDLDAAIAATPPGPERTRLTEERERLNADLAATNASVSTITVRLAADRERATKAQSDLDHVLMTGDQRLAPGAGEAVTASTRREIEAARTADQAAIAQRAAEGTRNDARRFKELTTALLTHPRPDSLASPEAVAAAEREQEQLAARLGVTRTPPNAPFTLAMAEERLATAESALVSATTARVNADNALGAASAASAQAHVSAYAQLDHWSALPPAGPPAAPPADWFAPPLPAMPADAPGAYGAAAAWRTRAEHDLQLAPARPGAPASQPCTTIEQYNARFATPPAMPGGPNGTSTPPTAAELADPASISNPERKTAVMDFLHDRAQARLDVVSASTTPFLSFGSRVNEYHWTPEDAVRFENASVRADHATTALASAGITDTPPTIPATPTAAQTSAINEYYAANRELENARVDAMAHGARPPWPADRTERAHAAVNSLWGQPPDGLIAKRQAAAPADVAARDAELTAARATLAANTAPASLAHPSVFSSAGVTVPQMGDPPVTNANWKPADVAAYNTADGRVHDAERGLAALGMPAPPVMPTTPGTPQYQAARVYYEAARAREVARVNGDSRSYTPEKEVPSSVSNAIDSLYGNGGSVPWGGTMSRAEAAATLPGSPSDPSAVLAANQARNRDQNAIREGMPSRRHEEPGKSEGPWEFQKHQGNLHELLRGGMLDWVKSMQAIPNATESLLQMWTHIASENLQRYSEVQQEVAQMMTSREELTSGEWRRTLMAMQRAIKAAAI